MPKPNLSYKPAFTETVESKVIARYVLKSLYIRAEKEHWDHEVSFTETAEQTGTVLGPARDHVHTCGNSFNAFIIVTRPKPAYGRQGLAGSWGQDTDQAGTFWGVLNVSFRACSAQLGFRPTLNQ